MTLERPETPRDRSRGVSSWRTYLYEETAVLVAAWARGWSLFWSVWVAASAIGLCIWPSWNLAAGLLVAVVILGLHIWLGFYYLANPEWREYRDDDA